VTRFEDFRDQLDIAPDILTSRLGILVDEGVMDSLQLSPDPPGEQLRLVLAALQQWGDDNRPPAGGPSTLRRSADRTRPVRVAFVDDTDVVIPEGSVIFTPAGSLQP
jgi:DNA-binding HxlR family transcriptional regulator